MAIGHPNPIGRFKNISQKIMNIQGNGIPEQVGTSLLWKFCWKATSLLCVVRSHNWGSSSKKHDSDSSSESQPSCLRKILRKCGGFKAAFVLLNFYFMEISNNGIKSLFLPAVVSDIFHKPHIQNLLSNLKLVTKSTGAIIGLNMNGFSLFLMFLGSNIPFFLLITRLQPLLCTTELYWRN